MHVCMYVLIEIKLKKKKIFEMNSVAQKKESKKERNGIITEYVRC